MIQRYLSLLKTKMTLVMLGVILTAGALGCWWIVVDADRQMRTDLLEQARLVKQAVNVENIRAFSGTLADQSLPSYQEIQQMLVSMRAADRRYQFIYVAGRSSDGSIVPFVDSEQGSSSAYSSFGEILFDVSAKTRHVFDSKTATVEGPVADRWGSWVSAVIPLIDPVSGEVIAVAGIDIAAVDWNLDLAARSAVPVGLLLVMLIGVSAAFGVSRDSLSKSVTNGNRPILVRLLLPQAVMLILAMFGIEAIFGQQQRQRLGERTASEVVSVKLDLNTALAQQSEALSLFLQPVVLNPGVQKALLERDRFQLLNDWQPVFARLQQDYHLTHFYFLDANRLCLLRVYNPEKFGDRIDHLTVLEAERSGKIAFGLELGSMGTFTLRVVQPVFVEGKLVGYVELGKEINEILQSIPPHAGIQLAVLIRKQYLNQAKWEEGMRLLGRVPDWEYLPDSVVAYTTKAGVYADSSQGRLYEIFTQMSAQSVGEAAQRKLDLDFSFEDQNWHVTSMPLKDVADKEVGDLLVMVDISAEKATYSRQMILTGSLGALLLALLLGVSYVLFLRTDRLIVNQQAKLLESGQRFRSLFDDSPISLWEEDFSAVKQRLDGLRAEGVVDFDTYFRQHPEAVAECLALTQVVDVNKATLRLYEATSKDDLVRNLAASFPKTGSDQFRAELVQIASGTTHFEMEMLGQTLHGRMLTVNMNWAVIPGYESNLSKTIVSIIDITERKQTDDQLRQLSRAVEHSPASIVITDIDGNIEYVNPKFSTGTGYSLDEVRGKNPRVLKSGKTPVETYSDLWQTILSGKEWRGEFLNCKKNGEYFWEYASISAITDSKGGITHFIGVKEDVTERKAAEEKIRLLNVELEKLALTDELTGINNHRSLLQRADHELSVAMRYRQPLSMMFFDIDYFKQINDSFGHAMGDQALKKTIQAVCGKLRSADVIGRYGGDEFVILLPQTSAQEALSLAERLHESVAAMRMETESGPLTLTISIGIAQTVHHITQPDSLENLLQRADQALYAAKQAGRNCTIIASHGGVSNGQETLPKE